MAESIPSDDPLEHWHRRLSPIMDWLILSGDLHPDRRQAVAQVARWRAAGVTAVVDVREEWSDEDVVAELAPQLRYWHLGTDDDGARKEDAWFDAGLAAYREACADPGARLLVHCHMGINRGPSMGFRFLLEAGEDPLAALEAVRRARPIAAIAYADDALDHFHRSNNVPPDVRNRHLLAVEHWMNGNGVASSSLIRRIRAEFA